MAEGTNVEGLMGSLNSFMNSLRTNKEEDRDENGNVVASRILDAQGKVLFSDQYTYDESGRRLSHDSFKDGKLKSREEISYDENGFKTTKYFNGDNVPQRIVRLDDKGRQVGTVEYDLHGNLESFSSQTYKENGEENETVSYKMIHGKIHISSQTFCDDNGTRHIRSYYNDEVTMSYQTKDLRFPNQVWVPTKDDWSRDRAAAEEHLNAYKAEEAFFKSKSEPKMDAWVASFGERADEPVKEEQKVELAEEVKQAEPEKTVEEKQAEPVREEQKAEPAEEVKQAEPEKTVEEKQAEPVREEQTVEPAEEVKQAESEKTADKDNNQYVDAAGLSHFVTRDENGQILADRSVDKDGNTQSDSYYKNGVLDSKTIYNEDGSKHSFFYENDGSVRSEKLVSADGRSVSSIAHTGGMTTTELLDEQGRTAYTVSYYNDGGKLYPWNEHSYAYDADGKQTDDQVRSFGTDGEKGGKTSEELLASLQHKDEWLMQTFADRVSGRVTAEEAQKTAEVANTVEEKQAEPVREEQTVEPAEEVKRAEPVQEERKVEPAEEVKQSESEKTVEEKQAEQVAEADANVNMIMPASEEREEQQAEQAAEADANVNTIMPASEEREEQQAEQAAEADTYVNTITSGSEEQEEKQPGQVYDEDGRLGEQTLYDNLGGVYGSVSYVYSDDGSTSVYTYDIDGQQTGFDSFDAEGRRKFAADFSNGVQQNLVRFDDEGRPTNIELYNEGQPAISTSIQYDGDAVYKDVYSADGQLLRSETTRDGRMSIVDYVDQKARTLSFDKIGDVDSFTDYAIQDGKAVKVKDGKFNLSGQEMVARFYDADGRMTEGLIRDSEESVTNYSFNEDGSYKESGPNGDKTHRAIRLFGKNVYTPQMPEFSENWSNEIPVAVDGDNHPQLSEQELACFRQGYVEVEKGGAHTEYYSERLPCIKGAAFRTKLFTQAADRLAQAGGVKREASNDGAEQSFVNTIENGGDEQTAENIQQNAADEQNAERQAQAADDRVPSEWEKSVNENRDEQVYVAENGDEKNTSKGLGEDDLMKQGQNLRQWINYFGMEGSRAKPPYASPFEKITTCRNLQGLALADLANGNTVINSSKRLELVVRSKEGEKKEPTLDECMTLVRLGQQKGWTSIRITGSPAFQKQMYLACRSLGMPTKDFVPTPEMLKEGADLENAFNSKDKLLPQSAEDKEAGKPEMREPTLTERCADLDSRFYALEKVREAQPAREQTAEDPYPDLANFDTIRAAEKLGIRPITAVEKEPADLDGKLKVLDKRSNDALDNLMQTEKNRKETLFHTAESAQRGEWRDQLAAVEQKEQSGQALSDADYRVKDMADKYQINSDPAKEPEKVPVINRADFDLKNEKALRKKEVGVEVGTAFAAAVVRREAATNAASLIASDSAEIPATKDLLATAKKELKQIAGAHQPISETLRQIGNINAQTVQQTEQNKQNYSGATKRKMRDTRQATEASKKLDARVVAAASQRSSR